MRKEIATVAVMLLAPLAAGAQRTPLSLEEAVASGLERNPALRASRAAVDSRAAETRETAAARLPSLKLGGGYSRLSEVPDFQVTLPFAPDPIVVSRSYFDNFSLRLGLQQPVFTGLRLEAGERSARDLEAAAAHDLEMDRAELVYAVESAYWGLARAREIGTLVEENVRQVAEHLKDVRAFFEQGLATRNDVLLAELGLSNAEILRLDARNAAEVALTVLDSLIGLPLRTDVELTTSAASRASRVPAAAAASDPVDGAPGQRADLKAADLRIKASEWNVKAARSGYYPQVFLAGNVYYLRPNPRYLPALDEFKGTWDLGLSVSFDLWDWGRTKSRTEGARARLAQARSARELLEDRAILEVTQSRLGVSTASDKIRVAGLAVGQAEENVRVVRERFRQGVALSADVLDAETALLRARVNRAQAEIDLVLAQARLEKALGL